MLTRILIQEPKIDLNKMTSKELLSLGRLKLNICTKYICDIQVLEMWMTHSSYPSYPGYVDHKAQQYQKGNNRAIINYYKSPEDEALTPAYRVQSRR